MTIKKLKEFIKDLPDDMPVVIPHDEFSGYYSPEKPEVIDVIEVESHHWTEMPYRGIYDKDDFYEDEIKRELKVLKI